jgi:hypothetical protein
MKHASSARVKRRFAGDKSSRPQGNTRRSNNCQEGKIWRKGITLLFSVPAHDRDFHKCEGAYTGALQFSSGRPENT